MARNNNKVVANRNRWFKMSVRLLYSAANVVTDHSLANFGADGYAEPVDAEPLRHKVQHQNRGRNTLPAIIKALKKRVLCE